MVYGYEPKVQSKYPNMLQTMQTGRYTSNICGKDNLQGRILLPVRTQSDSL